jgi:hypothetical protein
VGFHQPVNQSFNRCFIHGDSIAREE